MQPDVAGHRAVDAPAGVIFKPDERHWGFCHMNSRRGPRARESKKSKMHSIETSVNVVMIQADLACSGIMENVTCHGDLCQ